MRDPRSFYEASVVLVPTDAAAGRLVDDMDEAGLSDVGRLDPPPTHDGNGDGARYQLTSIGGGWAADRSGSRHLDEAMEGADVVVFVVADLGGTDRSHLVAVAEATRAAGGLLAGVTVGSMPPEETARGSLATLREQVDMLVAVSDPRFARAFVDVLRGGRRLPAEQDVG
jgi:hypothetical protein